MQIRLANPRGFCAGVDRAIDIVNRALDVFGPPVYVRHEVVHNRYVVDGLRERGAYAVRSSSSQPLLPGGPVRRISGRFVPLAFRRKTPPLVASASGSSTLVVD